MAGGLRAFARGAGTVAGARAGIRVLVPLAASSAARPILATGGEAIRALIGVPGFRLFLILIGDSGRRIRWILTLRLRLVI